MIVDKPAIQFFFCLKKRKTKKKCHFPKIKKNNSESQNGQQYKGVFRWGDVDQDQSSKTSRIMVHEKND